MEHSRLGGRIRSWSAWLLLGLVGCHVFNIVPHHPDWKEPPPPSLPSKVSHRLPPYVFFADFELKKDLPLFNDLEHLRDQVQRELQLPDPKTPIMVYLFEDREKYERFMKYKYPHLPKRRAFFVANPRAIGASEDLLVYTHWNDRIQQDLRHELTHALLHSVLKDVPLWLDEGLAEYFETPQGWSGINYQHLDLLRRGPTPFTPSLGRLEQLTDVRQMTPAEYRESWAWVHLMLRSNPKAREVLIAYLRELQTNKTPGQLRPRLETVLAPLPLEPALERHLNAIEATKPNTTTFGQK